MKSAKFVSLMGVLLLFWLASGSFVPPVSADVTVTSMQRYKKVSSAPAGVVWCIKVSGTTTEPDGTKVELVGPDWQRFPGSPPPTTDTHTTVKDGKFEFEICGFSDWSQGKFKVKIGNNESPWIQPDEPPDSDKAEPKNQSMSFVAPFNLSELEIPGSVVFDLYPEDMIYHALTIPLPERLGGGQVNLDFLEGHGEIFFNYTEDPEILAFDILNWIMIYTSFEVPYRGSTGINTAATHPSSLGSINMSSGEMRVYEPGFYTNSFYTETYPSLEGLGTVWLCDEPKSPRHCIGLDMYFYETPEQAYEALKEGDIDAMDCPLTLEQYYEVIADPTIQLAPSWPGGWYGYRKNFVGIVSMEGKGPVNKYTYLNAFKVDDAGTAEDESQEPIQIGLSSTPNSLNPLYCEPSSSGWNVMDEIAYTHLFSLEPYNLAVDNPWAAQDLELSTWFDPNDGETKSVIKFWIRKDAWWHAPVTGDLVRQFIAHDVEFTIWYIYAFNDCAQWQHVESIHHTNIIDDFTIEVYFDAEVQDYNLSREMPLLPKYEYLDLLCKKTCVVFEIAEPVEPSTKMIFTEDQVIQIINVTKYPEEIPLIEGVDYEIFATGPPDYCHNEIHWLRPLEPGEWIKICYWTPDLDPHGYYLANLPWELTWFSLGTHYPIEIVPGVGGYAIFGCARLHFIGAPPLGEIDWKWTWQGTVKPRGGYYQVFLYDAVRLLSAYCSRGDGTPLPNWFPGADIDANDLCHVGLYDAVTLLVNYGKKFGMPP